MLRTAGQRAVQSVQAQARVACAARQYHKNVSLLPSHSSGRVLLATPALLVAHSCCTQVVDHYDNPRNVGSFNKGDADVGTGLVGAPACGDVMKLQIKVHRLAGWLASTAGCPTTADRQLLLQVDDNGNIIDSCFKTFGCGSAIASSSVATEWVKGKSVDEVLTIRNSDIAKHLSLPPVKLHCSMLAEDAIKAAVKDIQAKRAKAAASPSLDDNEEKLAAAVAS